MDDIAALFRQALRLTRGGNHAEAQAILRKRLATETETDPRAEIASFLADLLADQDPVEARTLYEEARQLAGPASYRRYTIELALADISARFGRDAEAADYYQHAIQTALDARDIAAGSAIAQLLQLRRGALSESEHQLCVSAVVASWNVLGLEGNAPVDDLSKAAATLIRAAAGYHM